MYEYHAKLVRVVDGDTIVVDIDMGKRIWVHDEAIRLFGINAPEMSTELGRTVKAALAAFLASQPPLLTIQTIKDKDDKYGRLLGVVRAGDTVVNDWLVASGYAVKKVY